MPDQNSCIPSARFRAGRLVGEGWVVKSGRAIVFTEARLFNGDDAPVATASGTAVVQDYPGGAGLTGG